MGQREIEKRWLLLGTPNLQKAPGLVETIATTTTFLKGTKGKNMRRVQEIHSRGRITWMYTRKERHADGGVDEEKFPIGQQQYRMYLKEKHPDFRPIRKIRYIFETTDGKLVRRWELDEVIAPKTDVRWRLELEDMGEFKAKVVTPDFLGETKDVTGQKKYTLMNLDRKHLKRRMQK
jgi:hypothetical protein